MSYHAFRHSEVRSQLFALAYNLTNFPRTLALLNEVAQRLLMTLREKLVKIGAREGAGSSAPRRPPPALRYRPAGEVAVSRASFAMVLRRTDRLRPTPLPLQA